MRGWALTTSRPFTHPLGGGGDGLRTNLAVWQLSIYTSMWGRLPVARRALHFRHVDPHTCLGGYLLMLGPDCGRNHFGSCPPAWARDQTSRWGRPLSPARPHVSPRGGETRPALQRPPAGRVSVHSPCVKGRHDTLQNCGIAPAFRSILPRRGRSQNRLDKTGKSRRFPHVPTRGRAQGCFSVRQSSRHFNPRPRAGCDGAASSLASPRQSFNLQRLRGVRPLPTKPPSLHQSISVHTPGVRLYPPYGPAGTPPISIHTPIWDATCRTITRLEEGRRFRSTSPHEVRPDAVSPPEGRRHLNLRSAAPHPPVPSLPSAPRRAKRARGRLPRALLKRSVPLISPSWRLRKPNRPLSSRCLRPFQSGRT